MKGGGGLIVYFASVIWSKKLTLLRAYKTLEAIAVESRRGSTDILLLAIYGPPRLSRKGRKMPPEDKYLQKVEEEINDICQRASFQKQTIVIVGDWNMDRLKPDSTEGKILTDLEERSCKKWNVWYWTKWSPYGHCSQAQYKGNYLKANKKHWLWSAQTWYSRCTVACGWNIYQCRQ